MAQFHYKAKQGPQKIVSGSLEAESFDGAVARILQMGYMPLDVKNSDDYEEKKALKFNVSLKTFLDFSHKVPSSERTRFIRQVGDLLDAGVPVLRTLSIVGEQTKHAHFKEVIRQMTDFVQDGGRIIRRFCSFSGNFFSPV